MKNNVMVDVEENMESPAWLSNVEPFAQKVLQKLEKNAWEVSVLFCTAGFIQNLNSQYRQIDSPTDILSFEDGGEYEDEEGNMVYAAGDIAICTEVFLKNAAEFGVTADEELKRLVIHGLLHLSGMDHGEAHIGKDRSFEGGTEEDKEMLELQEKLMEEFASESIIR